MTRIVPQRLLAPIPYRRRADGWCRFAACLFAGVLTITSCDIAGKPAPPQARPSASPPERTDPKAQHECLVSQGEVESLTRKTVHPPNGDATESGGCVFRFTDDSGGIDVAVESHPSGREARDSIETRYRSADQCCTLRRIPGLGQDAVSITGNSTGTSVLVLLNRKVLIVSGDRPIARQVIVDLATKSAHRI